MSDNAAYCVKGECPKRCKSLGIRATLATVYHTEAIGITEAQVQALQCLLRALVKQEYQSWDRFLPFAVFAFNIYASCN